MSTEGMEVKTYIVDHTENELLTPEQLEDLLRKFTNCNTCLSIKTFYDENNEYIGFSIIGDHRTLYIDNKNKILGSMLMRIVEDEISKRKGQLKQWHNDQYGADEFLISSNSIHTSGPELEASTRNAHKLLRETAVKVRTLGGYEIKDIGTKENK